MESERLCRLFEELVAIESPSRVEQAMGLRCAQELEALGATVVFDTTQSLTGSNCGNLIATLPGTRPGHLVLAAHLDTVEPCHAIEVVRERVPFEALPVEDPSPWMTENAQAIEIYRSQGETILSADDKAGVAAILEAVRQVVESGVDRPQLTILFTVGEEISLQGASALAADFLTATDADAAAEPDSPPCYVFDADGRPGSLIVGAPCHWTFEARFTGKAAHAGVEPEVGRSAISMAAQAIAAMNLGRLDEETTTNVGQIQGGVEVNVVAQECLLRGECRSRNPEKADVCRQAMESACYQAAKEGEGTVDIQWVKDYPAVAFSLDDPLVRHFAQAAKQAGLSFSPTTTGGGSDANVLGEKGLRAICCGIGMTNFHSSEEFIAVEDLEATTCLIEALITTESK